MPRNRSLLKGGASASGSSAATSGRGGMKKIVIRPYSKPPTLPANYYEETTQELLQGTLSVLKKKAGSAIGGRTITSTVEPNLITSSLPASASADTSHAATSAPITTSNTKPTSGALSLQNAYTATVHLVSHQYGPQLYRDLVATLEEAARFVLPDSAAITGNFPATSSSSSGLSTTNPSAFNWSSSSSSAMLLTMIPKQYHMFTEYLLLCKHIFLPLDRTHCWQPETCTAVATRGGGVVGSNTTAAAAVAAAAAATHHPHRTNTIPGSSNFHPTILQSIWQVGLSVFYKRLIALQLDAALYQEWLSALLQDWNGSDMVGGSGGGGGGLLYSSSSTTSTTSSAHRQDLQAVWYMWQDLGLLQQLSLQQDLEQYWFRVSRQWADLDGSSTTTSTTTTAPSSFSYPAQAFLQFAVAKHAHVSVWPWLPLPWLWHILDHQLVQPHMNVEFLLNPQHLHPLLSNDAFPHHASGRHAGFGISASVARGTTGPAASSTGSMSGGSGVALSLLSTPTGTTTSWTPTQQLWMLAGRLPGGNAAVATAIAAFTRVQGLKRIQRDTGPTPVCTPIPNTSSLGLPTGNIMTTTPSTPQLAAVPTLMVQDILELQDAVGRMIRSLPSGTEWINLKSVWEEVVNSDVTPSVAEALAKFLDQVLRNNKKMDQYSSQEENWLQKIIAGLFVPMQSKDVFEAFYKRDLAKRLLYNRAVSMDVEKQVCSLLKAECGALYTSKMEGMFQDVDYSRETMMVYKQSAQATANMNGPVPTVEMEVQVLTTGYWPVYPQYPNLNLPESLQIPRDHFANHYKTKYQGRRMTWQYALGQCVVRSNGFPKTYEFVVSLCQALVLIQFVAAETRLTLPELMQAVGLEDRDEMERILQSLSLAKEGTRILLKQDYDAEPNKKKKIRPNVDDRDAFIINTAFTSNQRRIRITNIMMKETKEERDKTVDSVSRDRLYSIDAALVRIMKSRKTLLHQALIPQVLEQIKFPAQPADIKKRIEVLIDREYMERDGKDRNRYNYLA